MIFISVSIYSQRIMSWNIQNLGEVKYKKDTILTHISQVIKESNPDIIAIQEVSINKWGDSCIVKISNILNYNYIISKRTTGDGPERYAFLYKKNIKMKWSKLDKKLEDSIDREPFMASFLINKKEIIIRQVHLVPRAKKPQNEVMRLNYKDGIICGDFNLSCDDKSFSKLLSIYNLPLSNSPTSLKRDGTISDNSYDHFFIDKSFNIKSSSVIFYDYKWNRNILSDHLPIIIDLDIKK